MSKIGTIDLATILADMHEDQNVLLRFHADSALLNKKHIELIEQYPDQYAGAYDGTIIIAPTPEELFRQFGDNAKYAAWVHLSTEPINFFCPA